MNQKIQSDYGELMDIPYNKDKTILRFYVEADNGFVMLRIAMYYDNNCQVPMNRAMRGMLVEQDEMYNIVHQQEVTIRWEGDNPYMNPSLSKKFLS